MRITVKEIAGKKGKGEKIVTLTAYDFSMAGLLDAAGVDILLVGDSVGMVCLGYESTVPVSMRDMIHHTKAVSRAARRALVVADMPFGSFQRSVDNAVRNAVRLLKEGGADAVKIEGGSERLEVVKFLRNADIPVMGHLGLTPQKATELGGYKLQGRTPGEASRMLEDAVKLEKAGVFALVLECVPAELARDITAKVKIPTIGIGAGPYCDGQVLVLYDLLGLQEPLRSGRLSRRPRFVRVYAPVGEMIQKAVKAYRKDVLEGRYPSLAESFSLNPKSGLKKVQSKHGS